MTLLVCIVFLGLTYASTPPWNLATHISEEWFRPNREYRYLFDGQITTGLAIPNTQQSITRLQAIVILQPVNDHAILFKLTQIRFGTMLEEFNSQQILPFDHFQLVKFAEEHKEMLSIPIRFVYRNGIVGEIEFSQEDEPWSVNIKKAVINMLQINQLKKEEYDNDPRGEANNNKYFVAVERTFEGECEVEYTINNLPEGKTQWSKSINFQKCNTHPQIEYGMHPGRTDKSTNEKMFSTIIKHQVSETKGKILITEAELHSQYKLVPMSKKHEMITSVVHSKITLIYGGKVETAIHKLRRDRKETLIYNSELEMYEEKFAMTGDEKFLHRIPEWKNKVEHIEKLLSIIIRHLDEKIELETTHHFARLVKLLRLCSEGDLIKIQRFLTNQKKTNYNVMSIYYDALAMAGTRITVTELANIVNSEKIDSLRAVRLVKSLSEVPVPSEEIADQILSICEGEVAERVPYLKQACWLTYGAIYNRICWNERLAVQYVENICKRGLKEKFVGKLIDMFKKSDTRYEKVLMLKSLGNAGLDISVYSLEEIIHNKNEEKSVRNEAINALRKLCQFMPRKVQNILMPIFKDRTEVPQVRMSALRIIMETMPRQVVVDQIVHQMEIERDHNIRSFIFNVLKSISQSTKTEEMTAFSVNKALRTIKTEFYEKLNNRVPTWTANNEDMQYGTTLSLQYLFTKDSILPKDLLASLDTIIGGKLYKHFAQLGFSQQDIDNILSKLLHKFEESGLEQIVVRGRRSTKYRASDIFRAISEKLNLVRRNNKKEDPQMMFYVRYKDMDYAFLPIDINTIPKLFGNVIRDGKIQLDEIEHILATGTQFQSSAGFFIYESVRKIPTALGLPLVLTSNMPTVVTVQGHIKVELEPKRSSILNGLRVRLLLKPRVATTHVIKAIAFYPAVESGFKLLHSATFEHPLNCEIEVMMKDQFRTKLVFRPPEHRTNLIHYQSRPAVLIRHIKKITHAYPESTEVTVHLHKQLYPTENFEYNYLKKYGTLVKMMGTIHRQVIRKTESFLNPILIGYNTLDIMTEPTQDMAEEYVFNMELETFVPVIMEKPTVDKLFKTHDEFSEVDGEDLEQRRGGDRRAQIYTYLKNLDIGKAYQHRIVFKFETIGQRDKNEIEVELVAKCENKYRYCQTQLRGRRSPLVMEKSKWEMNVEVQTVYPETPKTLNNLKKFHREFHGFINARWGNQETNNVLIRMQGEQSREQKLWMKNYNQIFKSKLTEMERVKLASDLNLYKFVASYRFTPETEYYISKLFSFLNIWQMWNIDYAITKNEEGRVRAQLNIDPLSRRTFDLHIYTPQSRIVIKKVALPFSFASVTVHNPNLDEITSMKDIISHVFKNNRAECIIKSSNVNTFDNMYFKFPLTTCYTVMAKDCSNEDPKFAVLLKKKEKNRKEKKLKLITRQNVYEIEMRNNELIGKLNGREIGLEDKKYRISKIHENLYQIELDDVSVVFDGFQANIKLSHLYKNKQCGVCGHYDGERWNDLRRADNEEATAVQDFHASYITKDDGCKYDEKMFVEKDNRDLEFDLMNHNYRNREEEEEESKGDYAYDLENVEEDKKNSEPIPRTRVIERENRVCFSLEPVLECPKYTTRNEVRKEEVEFVCLRSSNHETRSLLRKARKHVISRSSLNGEGWSTTLSIPKTCTVY